jgi:hypothetical protein
MDPGGLPGLWFLSVPDSRSRLQDPTKTSKQEGKNLLSYLFFVATNFTKLKIIFEHVQEKLEPFLSKKFSLGS